jgi:hypothetical protein
MPIELALDQVAGFLSGQRDQAHRGVIPLFRTALQQGDL